MKTKTLRKDKVNIITLGCSKNVVDSEVLSVQLKANDINTLQLIKAPVCRMMCPAQQQNLQHNENNR